MSGSKFDFKVEIPTVVAADQIEVLINGESYDKVLIAHADKVPVQVVVITAQRLPKQG